MEDRDDRFADLPDRERMRPRRSPKSEPDERPAASGEPDVFDAHSQLPDAVLMVPNQHWGFSIVSGTDHPGACVSYKRGANFAKLVKGTDADHVRNPRRYFVVEASEQNGLKKQTAFELEPHRFRLHRLKLLFGERYLGRLVEPVLHALQIAVLRLYPEE